MPSRALIIAIENYSKSIDLARSISGATATGEQVFDWLTTVKQLSAENVYVCAEGGKFLNAKRYLTEREAIVDAMAEVVSVGQDQTEELFVFFSGHGYCFQESLEKRAIDVLVAGDFVSAAASGTKCLKLQEVQEKLYGILGGQHHYYFIDACRIWCAMTRLILLGWAANLVALHNEAALANTRSILRPSAHRRRSRATSPLPY